MTVKQLHSMQHDQDPKRTILESVGDIKGIKLPPRRLLVGNYIRPEKTSGGIHLPQQFRKEDVYQGKVYLVLAKGDGCFEDYEDYNFNGFKAEVGDWIVVRVAYGLMTSVNGLSCKIVKDAPEIELVIPNPDIIY